MNAFIESENDSMETTRRHFVDSLQFPLLAVLTIWLAFVFQWITLADWGEWGIYPRRIWGMTGIFTGPLVHGSWGHLASNTAPLFALTFITMYFYRKVAMRAFWMIYLLTGVAVWLLARPVYHIGASGVVYGLVAFIFWNGIFRRSLRSIILALIVMVLYSGMFMGVLPDQEGVSWESHLLGSFAGIFASFWFKGELEEDEADADPYAEVQSEEKQYFLPRDAFDMTKEEREAAALARRQALEEELRRQAAEQEGRFFPPPGWYQSSTW